MNLRDLKKAGILIGVKKPNQIKYIPEDIKKESGKYLKIIDINLSYEKKIKALPKKNPKKIKNMLIKTENNETANE